MEVLIRTAEAADAPALCALVQELARANHEESPVTPQFVQEYLRSPGCAVLLAEVGDRAVGLLSCSIRPNLYHAGPAALIEELIVASDMRGAGVGGRLVEAAIDGARQAGCAEISVSTMFQNSAAQRFYRKLGFGDDALLLEIHFSSPAGSGGGTAHPANGRGNHEKAVLGDERDATPGPCERAAWYDAPHGQEVTLRGG